jgi:hypothetical protein
MTKQAIFLTDTGRRIRVDVFPAGWHPDAAYVVIEAEGGPKQTYRRKWQDDVSHCRARFESMVRRYESLGYRRIV